ncbi:MAG TPA: hypothetical protein VK459_28610, partial [Polyangiaceae bacterium]|nr:hypothetical protein [Polyangiaceae bacterium]
MALKGLAGAQIGAPLGSLPRKVREAPGAVQCPWISGPSPRILPNLTATSARWKARFRLVWFMAECSRGGDCYRARLPGRKASRAGSFGLAAAAALFVGSITGTASADEAQELELGKNRFDAGRYEEAVKRFTTMLNPSVAPCEKSAPKKSGRCRLTDKVLIEGARAFVAASLVALGRIPEADVHIETIFRQNPTYAPDPALFPAEVIDRFTEVKARISAELEELARKEAAIALQKRMAEQKVEDDQRRWLEEIQRLAGQQRVVTKNSRVVAS